MLRATSLTEMGNLAVTAPSAAVSCLLEEDQVTHSDILPLWEGACHAAFPGGEARRIWGGTPYECFPKPTHRMSHKYRSAILTVEDGMLTCHIYKEKDNG